MKIDAAFEDGQDRPLRLWAQDADDIPIISAMAQDAIFPISEMSWRSTKREFALLINRFRWEDAEAAKSVGRDFERVQSVLEVGDVLGVKSQGIDRADTDTILSLLSLGWEPGADGAGRLTLTLAGDGAIALDVECIDLRLTDVTRPYRAPSGKMPDH